MRKYYIFELQSKTYQKYRSKPTSLFVLMSRLRKVKKETMRGGISLYNQICEPFKLERLYDYFEKKYQVEKRKHYYFTNKKRNETYLLELNPSCLILLTKSNFPLLFQTLYYYSPYLFVCDFENGDYFFLEDVFKK